MKNTLNKKREKALSGNFFSLIISLLTIVIISTTAFPQSWTSLQSPTKPRDVRDVSVSTDGAIAYVCDKSGIFKTTDNGATWTATFNEVPSPLAIFARADNGNVILAGVAESLRFNWNQGNEGYSWYKVLSNAGTPMRLIGSTVTNYTGYLYYGRQASGSNTSIFVSGNGGSSWSQPYTYPSGTNVYDIAAYPVSGSRVGHAWAGGTDPSGTSNEGGDPNATQASLRGVWKSTNFGVDWTQQYMGNFNVRSVAIANQATPFIYAGTSTGKLYRSDEGVSWTSMSNYQTSTSATTISAVRVRADNNYVFVASDQGIHRSTNSGNNWEDKTPNANDKNILSLAIARYSQNIMYATTAIAVYRTSDGGSSWTTVNTGLGRIPLSFTTGNGNNVWLSTKLTDSLWNYNGTSWSFTEVSGFYSNHVMRNSSGDVFASGVNTQKAGIYKSTNSGQSYSALYQSATQGTGNIFNASMPDPSNNANTFVWGKDGSYNLYRIYSNGSKDNYLVGSSAYAVNDIAFATTSSTGAVYFAKETDGVLKCNSGPCSGTTVLSGVTARSLAINTNSPSTIYAATTSGIRKSINAGSTWTSVYGTDCKRIILSPGFSNSDQHIIALWNNGSKIYFTNNGGTTWSDVTGNVQTPVYDIRGEAGSPAVLYAATEHGAYKITAPTQAPTLASPGDGASVGIIPTLTWNAVSGISTYHLLIATDANFSNVVVEVKDIATTSYSPYTLSAGTYYWKVASTNFVGESGYSTSRSFATSAQGTITLTASAYLGGDGLVHPRLTWTHSGQGTNPIFYIYKYSCTYGAPDCGVWPYPMIGTTTSTTFDDPSVNIATKGQTPTTTYRYQVRSAGISDKVSYNATGGGDTKTVIALDNLPKETKLEANFPNPFNPVTEIKYSLHEDAQVSLIVYDVLGREVETLVNGMETAGYKSVQFNASSLPSGVYFYRLSATGQTASYTDMKRMILMK
jgi:hypothetical protein